MGPVSFYLCENKAIHTGLTVLAHSLVGGKLVKLRFTNRYKRASARAFVVKEHCFEASEYGGNERRIDVAGVLRRQGNKKDLRASGPGHGSEQAKTGSRAFHCCRATAANARAYP